MIKMFLPGGLDFDGIDGPTNTSSEDEHNKEQLSNRSDQSNVSSDSTSSCKSLNNSQKFPLRKTSLFQSSILENESEVNSSTIKQKEMVMNEIRQKVFSSDSERENDLIDSIDGLEFGRTPPRELRRNKQKYKCVKFNNQMPIQQPGFNNVKKSSKKNSKSNQSNVNSGNFSSSCHWQRQRSEERREKQMDKVKIQTRESTDDLLSRSTKLVRVNSLKSLKSISQQKTANAFSRSCDYHNSKKFLSSAMKFATAKRDAKSKGSNRHHFYKSFSLLVNLGGRFPYQQHQNSVDIEEEDNFQVEYHEFLWLQLQAYHAGRSLEEQDNYLEESRKDIDKILDEVINFKFDAKNGVCNVGITISKPTDNNDLEDTNRVPLADCLNSKEDDEDDIEDEEFLTFKTSFDKETLTSSPRIEISENRKSVLTAVENDFQELEICDEKASCPVIKPPAKEEKVFNLLELRKEKISAMHEVSALIQKIESIEALYPNNKALMNSHPKYKAIRFVRNMEALLLWLNINKELYHRLGALADWIEIEPDDVINWKDWFDCGLDLYCLKTKKSYKTAHKITTADLLESSVNLTSVLSNVALRKSKREKRKRISQQRFSVIEKTSTSRYREFVERSIKENGLIHIMKRSREILYQSLQKARFSLLDTVEYVPKSRPNTNIAQFGTQLRTLLDIFLKLNDKDMANFLYDLESEAAQSHKFSQYSKCFQDLNLPSFVDIFSFMTMIPLDMVHECIRFRIDYKPKVQPSHLSIRQLILECKEVVAGGIITLYHFQELTNLISPTIKEQIEYRKREFDDDLKSILNIYFDYLQTWFHLMQKSKQASGSLKNIAEEEWCFAKEICPYIRGAEARAGFKFCRLSADLLRSTENFLESSIEDCSKKYDLAEDNPQRHRMLGACREYKNIFKEMQGRASKALAFARMLHKDLGIANKYKMNCSTDALFKMLKESNHFKIDYHGTNTDFWIFVSEEAAKNNSFSTTKLLSLTYGISDQDNSFGCGYVLLVPKIRKEKCLWIGRRLSLEHTDEVSLALSYITKVNYVTVISNNFYNLNTQCKKFEQRIIVGSVSLVSDRTSCHNEIEKAMDDLKESSSRLASSVINSVQTINENFCVNLTFELDETDRNSAHKSCIETMHCCFTAGFEYLRELSRIHHIGYHEVARAEHKINKINLSQYFVKFSKMWIQFVLTKTESGRGTKPRWAIPGLDFLVATIDPNQSDSMPETVFLGLQEEMQNCVKHIIGKAEAKSKRKLKADKRSSSPFTVLRSRSVPSQQSKESTNQSLESLSVDHCNSFPGEFVRETRADTTLSDTSADRTNLSNVSSEGDTLDSIEQSFLSGDTDVENDPPVIRIRNAIQEIEERRTAKLQHMHVIGNVTYKKPNFASELVHNVRRVNFKWQLGNKIGEGQFGKVYSAVNLDTGDLMAVKQVRFNPHDYGTIQDIADEITNIQGIQHESLVKYFGVELHKDEMLIFMDYCADGTIAEVAKLGLPESLIRVYTYQITKAINFLHQSGVVHRDIKGANIFLSSSGLIKIGDFGSAVKLKDAMCTTQGEVFNTRGTAAFMAPEVITLDKGRGYGRAADIWSLGCVVIEMSTGKQPWFECDNIYAIMYRVGDGNHPPIPDRLSEEGQDFLKCCFIHDQNYRWTAHMLEDHSFVKMKIFTENTLNRKLVFTHTENGNKEFNVQDQILDQTEIGDDEVLMKINSCSLPAHQHALIEKYIHLQSDTQQIPVGQDISGVVVAVGDNVEMFQIDDEVTGIIPANSNQSGCANYCRISQYDLVCKPERVCHVDAACAIGDSIKAYTALFYQAKIQSGETILILDACSGYGIIANQLAQYWGGKVIVAGSTDEEINFIQNLQPPASQVVDLRNKRQTLSTACLSETGGLGIDCVLDNKVQLYTEEYLDVIQSSTEPNRMLPSKFEIIASLGVGGRWVTQQHDLQLDPPDSEQLTLKCASLHFLFEHSWTLSKSAHGRYLHILNDVMSKMASGVLRPTVHHTVLFDDCVASLKDNDGGRDQKTNIGKIVVKIS